MLSPTGRGLQFPLPWGERKSAEGGKVRGIVLLAYPVLPKGLTLL
jgi:hypothetical protein